VDAGEKEVVTSQRDEDACATRVYRKRRSPANLPEHARRAHSTEVISGHPFQIVRGNLSHEVCSCSFFGEVECPIFCAVG
jgi:hypothetical protein